MKVFKFGGASVKDASSVRNVASVLQRFRGEKILVVVSAMGKMTNELEKLTENHFSKKENWLPVLEGIKNYHLKIMQELFSDSANSVFGEVNTIFSSLEKIVSGAAAHDYNC